MKCFVRSPLQLHHMWRQQWSRPLSTHSALLQEVRTRFAPSPTGELHLGSLRSALYNYLFARSQGGKFLLRIEDTDQTRTVPGAVDRLLHTLDTMGLQPDEGPGVGGPYGPYTQSERTALYRENVQRLLDSGAAYRCYCTRQRLQLLRRQALGRGEKPRYDNRCRHLSEEKRNMLEERGVSHVVRLKLENTDTPFTDLVYGEVTFDVAAQEGDPVLMKADHFPTYHLANVVDDHLMRVTHVLRGVEWQVSTPKHIALYRALGWDPPQFAHLPLVTNPDGTKLSKRHGDASVESHLQRGVLPEALLNYVCLAGGGFKELDQTALTSARELTEKFELSRVNTSSCRLDPERLRRLNLLALRRRHQDSQHREKMCDRVRQLVTERFAESSGPPLAPHVLSDAYIDRVLRWSLDNARIEYLSDLVSRDFSYLWAVPERLRDDQLPVEDPAGTLSVLLDRLSGRPEDSLTKDELVPLFRAVAGERRIKFSALMKLLRLALSGVEEGPGVAEMIAVLGKEEALQRISTSIAHAPSEHAAQS
ncbi:putative glutamate--tRNA ligase, mitochondrial [Amphibalanus amphitrite]|uniref:Nondiscriminating glutamyl-tRNA synthetase EARS2, mitochondrial n=1 Tax=Amphibalanus amphitrite TaxID=1232801 RepID=A0A6A4X1Q2_AMPAM|nr:probable glutamate--tRNA ligase, mitochondrial isoform X1 [Amphibalanus amphitrite]XP_043193494.1 probable glutamate--tRNA ligase, mitochondrial isoform X1 [Amphibalanus amphitrite]XP_043193495.1 probable glutamate--tRNA ligase, mitochondrial isoform X1 [Amphibalanus amphitrite]XP_043193496.1 probable glutamate--tRNA ligase, mitochondrial isoform X1 [Amphibalanus amphitrite]XP_043193498.1 probable glutamate--tRNA ligase, mitochondrial isoform X1 [Amphibalanus amphitrite]XP_043193499.1 proba